MEQAVEEVIVADDVLHPLVATSAVAEYNRTEAGLADLRQRYAGVVFDMRTVAGDKAARAGRLELVKLRTSLDGVRKDLKAPLAAQVKLIDDEAKRITAEIKLLEEPIDAQIKADEARREAERKKREEQERQRAAAIRVRITEISDAPVRAATMSSKEIDELGGVVDGTTISEAEFGEFTEEALAVRDRSIAQLLDLFNAAQDREQAAAKLEEERRALVIEREQAAALAAAQLAELNRQRDEYNAAVLEAERIATEKRAEQERVSLAAEAARQAEAKRQADELQAERVELKRQQDAFEAERQAELAAARGAEARRAAEQLAIQAQAAAEQAEFEAAERAAFEAAQRADEQAAATPDAVATNEQPVEDAVPMRPAAAEVVQVVAGHFKVTTVTAAAWLMELFNRSAA
ncbi:MAG: hypothetical protein ABI574_04675 [Burkholderiales bacterium]